MLGTLTSVAQLDQKEFSRLLTLNIGAPQALLAAFDPLLRKADHPRVIALTSSVATNARPYWGGYAASKAAMEMLMLTYAEELKNLRDLRVAIVDPAGTRTAMRAKAYPGEDPATLKTPEVVGEAIAKLLIDDFETGAKIRIGA